MPLYLTRFRYTPETWAMLIAQPEDLHIRIVSAAAAGAAGWARPIVKTAKDRLSTGSAGIARHPASCRSSRLM